MRTLSQGMICLLGLLLCMGCMKKNEFTPVGSFEDSSEGSDSATASDSDETQIVNSAADTSSESENGSERFDEESTENDFSGGTDACFDCIDTETDSQNHDGEKDTDTSSDTTASGDTDTTCVANNVVEAVCDDDNRVVGLNVCGEAVDVLQECADTHECVDAECVCPEGWTGDTCLVPVVFVNAAAGADLGNIGRTWADAFSDLQDALEMVDGEGESEIWVTQGTYIPGTSRDSTFQLSEDARVYGGFLGTERALHHRSVESYPTVLDGDINQDDDGSFSMYTENVYHVVTGAEGAVLDGFTIRGGNANGDAETYRSNGGGLLARGVSVTVSNCIFTENQAVVDGGGMWMSSRYGRVVDSVFVTNHALNGAGLTLASAGQEMEGMRVINVAFQNNVADGNGGGLYVAVVSPRIGGCTFIENTAVEGGGVFAIATNQPVFSRCIFDGNMAVNGAGMFNAGSDSLVDNSLFAGNRATEAGGGVSNASYATSPSGPAGTSNAVFRNCTFVENEAAEDASAMDNRVGDVSMFNSVVWGNVSNAVGIDVPVATFSLYATFMVDQTLIQNGCANDTNVVCGEAVFDSDPRFVNAGAEDWRLSADSICVDAGDSQAVSADWLDVDADGNIGENISVDLGGAPRIADGNQNGEAVVDLGAYEFIPETDTP
ncbi:MAG: hypothetical protein JXX29_09380 [Deltaproteobacteria bacterium]|nr:hypothetical protein [Deltaproteobacteria bacterium]MBN2671875.1 hypothetical protein [Deltaproteobacteria bacterium]